MAEAFVGTWKLQETKNFDEYMKGLGVGLPTRKLANMTKPTTIIVFEDGKLTIKTQSSLKNTELSCNLGKEFKEHTADGRDVESIITIEDAKMIHVQKWDNKETSLVREINGNNLTLTLTLGEVVCTRLYEKAE